MSGNGSARRLSVFCFVCFLPHLKKSLVTTKYVIISLLFPPKIQALLIETYVTVYSLQNNWA